MNVYTIFTISSILKYGCITLHSVHRKTSFLNKAGGKHTCAHTHAVHAHPHTPHTHTPHTPHTHHTHTTHTTHTPHTLHAHAVLTVLL